jgi:hypothetical protein
MQSFYGASTLCKKRYALAEPDDLSCLTPPREKGCDMDDVFMGIDGLKAPTLPEMITDREEGVRTPEDAASHIVDRHCADWPEARKASLREAIQDAMSDWGDLTASVEAQSQW